VLIINICSVACQMRWFVHTVLISFLIYLILLNVAAHDSEKGVGWERFEFNKDAPLDDEEVEGQICFLIYLWDFFLLCTHLVIPFRSYKDNLPRLLVVPHSWSNSLKLGDPYIVHFYVDVSWISPCFSC